MEDVFIKKRWDEENILFYLHFKNNSAIEQMEVSSQGIIRLSEENPIYGDLALYDQSLEDLSLDKSDYISKEEFEDVWTNSILK